MDKLKGFIAVFNGMAFLVLLIMELFIYIPKRYLLLTAFIMCIAAITIKGDN